MVLLIVKLRSFKKSVNEIKKEREEKQKEKKDSDSKSQKSFKVTNYDIDEFEYKLLKLKHMKNTKVISQEEYKSLRDKLLKENNLKQEISKKEN